MPHLSMEIPLNKSAANALVIGGTGFIGKPICDFLSLSGFSVATFDLSYQAPDSPYPHFRGSITDPVALDAAIRGQDHVFHLAGMLGTTELIDQSLQAVDVNIAGTVHVLDACVRNRVTSIFYPTKPNTWLNTYSITKRAGEEFCEMYAREFGLKVRVLRWLNAYGPGQKVYPIRKAVPVMILQALLGDDLIVWGTGEQPVDLIHTNDLAEITVKYTLSSDVDAKTRDTGLSHRMTVNEMAALICRLADSSSKIRHLPMRKGEYQDIPVELLPGPSASDLLGIARNAIPLDQGFMETIDYYRTLGTEKSRNSLDFYAAIA